MSELPWENKKIAEIMSSVDDEVDTSADISEKKNSSTPPIPDILASAFADIPMEEAKIEIPEPSSDAGAGLIPEASTPFGDLPDLSALDQIKSEDTKSNSENISLPSAIPPFMNCPDISVISDDKGKIAPDLSQSLFNPDLSGMNRDPPVANAANSRNSDNKRSPPPLFELFNPETAGTEHLEDLETPVPNLQESEQNAPSSLGDALANGANPAVASNPFEPGPVAASPPFAADPGAVPNPFEPGPASASPPFDVNPGAASNPFDAGHVASVNPFESTSTAEANPFAGSPAPGANPFGEALHSNEQISPNDSSSTKESSKSSVNVAAFKKNMEGISVLARGFIKNLTKGKSLIERVEDMKGDTISDESSYNSSGDSSSAQSSFENESGSSVNPANSSFVNHFSSPGETLEKATNNAQLNPFEVEMGSAPVEDIRKVTPIDDPIMELDEKYSIADLVSSDSVLNTASAVNPDVLSADPELVKITPVDDSVVNAVDNAMDNAMDNNISPDSVLPDSKPDMGMAGEGNAEIENDINILKDNIGGMGLQVSSVRAEVDTLSSKFSDMDMTLSSLVKANEELLSQDKVKVAEIETNIGIVAQKLSDFESNLLAIESGNSSVSSDLSRMEDDISGLVNSYTALLAQLHESLQEKKSKFSQVDEISAKLDLLASNIVSIEKSNEDARSTSMEFSRSISSLIDNMGNLSSEFQDFRQRSKQKDVAMLEKITSSTEYVESELKKLGARSYKGFGQNVHLSNIVKNSGNMKLCMEWLEFLMELVGRNNLPDILSYYEELGWITDKVRMELLHYAEGIDFYMEKPDWKLTPDDHVKSIWFIESLAGMKVDKNRLSVIERDIEKVKKGSEIYGI